jgi:hypothetical protein
LRIRKKHLTIRGDQKTDWFFDFGVADLRNPKFHIVGDHNVHLQRGVRCPVARSLKGEIDITTSFELVPE